MWERAELKQRARKVLSKWYWYILPVTLILDLVSGGNSGVNVSYQRELSDMMPQLVHEYGQDIVNIGLMLIPFFALIIFAVVIMLSIFLFSPLIVGCRKFIMRISCGEKNYRYILSSFENGNYINIVKVEFFKNLQIFLWTLLFIIPGIVKSYEFRMVDYILAESPSIDYHDALRLSRDMMWGQKMRAFVLNLSFLGWLMLGVIALGIGVFFVTPYIEATYVQLYFRLKSDMIDQSRAYDWEFGGERKV